VAADGTKDGTKLQDPERRKGIFELSTGPNTRAFASLRRLAGRRCPFDAEPLELSRLV